MGPLTDQPLGPVAGGDHVVQPRAGRLAGRRGATGLTDGRASNCCPPTITDQLPGRGEGVPIVAARHGVLLVMAILVIYIVLGILYESFIHPLTILSGLPSAGFGALLTLI